MPDKASIIVDALELDKCQHARTAKRGSYVTDQGWDYFLECLGCGVHMDMDVTTYPGDDDRPQAIEE